MVESGYAQTFLSYREMIGLGVSLFSTGMRCRGLAL